MIYRSMKTRMCEMVEATIPAGIINKNITASIKYKMICIFTKLLTMGMVPLYRSGLLTFYNKAGCLSYVILVSSSVCHYFEESNTDYAYVDENP